MRALCGYTNVRSQKAPESRVNNVKTENNNMLLRELSYRTPYISTTLGLFKDPLQCGQI